MDQLRLSDEVIIATMQGVIDKFLKPKFISLGMNATGQWLESLEARVVNGQGQIWGMDYTYFLAHGRGPNKDQSIKSKINFAVWMAKGNPEFKAWLAVKGLTDYGVGIAYKIADEGTDYYPQGTDLLEILHSQEVADYIYSQLREGFTTEISEVLKKQLHDNFT